MDAHEYVPGDREPSVTLLIARDGTLLAETWLRKLRYASSSTSTCVVTTDRPPGGEAVIGFLREVGLVGIVSAQMKIDARTSELVLIEANARPGQNSRLLVPMWLREGVPVGAALVRDSVAGQNHSLTRPGIVGVSPIEDLAAVMKHVIRKPGRRHAGAYLRSYLQSLRARPIVDAWTSAAIRQPWHLGRSLPDQFLRTYKEPFDFISYGDVATAQSKQRWTSISAITSPRRAKDLGDAQR